MVICARMPDVSELIIDQCKFEQVVGFTYLKGKAIPLHAMEALGGRGDIGTKINKENIFTTCLRSPSSQ
jgi:hypothetical protein